MSMADPIDLQRARRLARERAVRAVAAAQDGMVARRQLLQLGVSRHHVRNQLAAGRWKARSATVLSTFTGGLDRRQRMWLGVLHGGPSAMLGMLSAAEVLGLRNWHREDITVLVPYGDDVADLLGVRFVRTRRDLDAMRTVVDGLPLCRIEPAILMFGADQRSSRTAVGVVAAAVQQQLTTVPAVQRWLRELTPLKFAPKLRPALRDMAGGSQSVAEIDVLRLCRLTGLIKPVRQSRRRDVSGTTRWTDCEWHLPDGHVIVLEVDGGFHMEVEHWEDDLARQRRISSPGRTVVRCTARELRDDSDSLARDLMALGVPRRAAQRAR